MSFSSYWGRFGVVHGSDQSATGLLLAVPVMSLGQAEVLEADDVSKSLGR